MNLKLFDYVKDLSFGKNDLSRLYPDEFMDTYSPYAINTVFSMRIDTLLYANEMNKFPDIKKQEHYDYYLYGLKKQNRYFKWIKAKNIEYLNDVCEHYNITREKGIDLVKVLTTSKLDLIRETLDHGGRK